MNRDYDALPRFVHVRESHDAEDIPRDRANAPMGTDRRSGLWIPG